MTAKLHDETSRHPSRRDLLGGMTPGAAGESATVPILLASHCLAVDGVACRLCDDACEPGAIRFSPQAGGHWHPAIHDAKCTGCLACGEVCPVGAFRVDDRRVGHA